MDEGPDQSRQLPLVDVAGFKDAAHGRTGRHRAGRGPWTPAASWTWSRGAEFSAVLAGGTTLPRFLYWPFANFGTEEDMRTSSWATWGGVLGFALGGFFDGILLHQILQWHHLLSLVPGSGDLRMQVLWDGYFHLLMYVVALSGLAGLWRVQRGGGLPWGRPLSGALLVGFGLWHVLDAVLSHWLLGIHRIRIDSDTPLLWDLAWLTVFGLLPLLAGWRLLRAGSPPSRGPAGAMLMLAMTAGGAGAWAALPPPGQAFATVVFHPAAGPKQVFAALDAVDGRLVWSDRTMGVVVMAVPEKARWSLYRHGALLVSGSGVPAGCFNWSRA